MKIKDFFLSESRKVFRYQNLFAHETECLEFLLDAGFL